MKAIIISDVHGYTAGVHEILEKEQNVDVLFFLGDGANDMAKIEIEYPHIKMYKVMGNCDFLRNMLSHAVVTIDGVNIFYTHGHLYYVKRHLRELLNVAKSKNAHIAMFGHTHAPLNETVNGVALFNPGAVSGNRHGLNGYGYGVLTIKDGIFALKNCVI